jgi:hypothetical protein
MDSGQPPRSVRDSALRVAACLWLLVMSGCDRVNAPTGTAANAPGSAATAHGMNRRGAVGQSADTQARPSPAVDDRALNDAMAAAQRTAEEARQRWQYTAESKRSGWAVKWAAPLVIRSSLRPQPPQNEPTINARAGRFEHVDAHAEHVWVNPVRWSPFRIEGVLASKPVGELECGRTLGELVSFPIEELSDWVHFYTVPAANAAPSAPHEGGFTLDVLVPPTAPE